jgi:hypothetical protein
MQGRPKHVGDPDRLLIWSSKTDILLNSFCPVQGWRTFWGARGLIANNFRIIFFRVLKTWFYYDYSSNVLAPQVAALLARQDEIEPRDAMAKAAFIMERFFTLENRNGRN